MILECLQDCYMEDGNGNLTNNRSFTKGKIYEVISSCTETRNYKLIDDNMKIHHINFFNKSFKRYVYNWYVVEVQGKGKLLLRETSHTGAVKKAGTFVGHNIDFSVAKIDFEMDDEGRTIRYEL